MTSYKCFLYGSAGSAGEQIDSTTVASAIELCRRILAARPHYSAFELWQSRRKIYGEGRWQATSSLPASRPAGLVTFVAPAVALDARWMMSSSAADAGASSYDYPLQFDEAFPSSRRKDSK